jgi:hypothetical protein
MPLIPLSGSATYQRSLQGRGYPVSIGPFWINTYKPCRSHGDKGAAVVSVRSSRRPPSCHPLLKGSFENRKESAAMNFAVESHNGKLWLVAHETPGCVSSVLLAQFHSRRGRSLEGGAIADALYGTRGWPERNRLVPPYDRVPEFSVNHRYCKWTSGPSFRLARTQCGRPNITPHWRQVA